MSESSIILGMVIDMNDTKLRTLAQVRAFLEGSAGVEFQPTGDDRTGYEHIGAVLRRFGYRALGRADKGLVRRFIWCIPRVIPGRR